VSVAIRSLELLFGRGDDDYPFWLLTIRINILLVLFCAAGVIWWQTFRVRRAMPRSEWWTILGLTSLAGALRFLVARPNLMDFGGIPYSRLLYGYKGYFATAQFYAPFYQLTARDIEHGILFQRLAGTLTIPLIYVLCRRWQPGVKLFPATTAFLFAVYPLHILFSASDALAVFSTFLAALAYAILAAAVEVEDERMARLHYLGSFAALALLTQVRYENVLLLIPPVIALLAHRRMLRPRQLLAPLLISGVFVAIYAYEAATSGISFRSPIDLQRGLSLTTWHLVLNPFLAIPLLFLGTVAVSLYARLGWGAIALLPWAAGLGLCVFTAEDGHGAARIYANWLVLILPLAGYGIARLLQSPRVLARAPAALALLCLASLPAIVRERLGTQYLEILEHERFAALLSTLPAEVERIIVPDDELMRRQVHSTLELYRKYAAIVVSRPDAAARFELVQLTDYLDNPQPGCVRGRCVFFHGLPCLDERYWLARDQCEQLLRERRTSELNETTVVAAPFVACSIYTGTLERELCDPATLERRLAVHWIDE
jgi:hypothetical protein